MSICVNIYEKFFKGMDIQNMYIYIYTYVSI